MAVLVTGGAGYIGSHTVLELIKNGEDVIVLDNLENGYKDFVLGGKLVVGDLRDIRFLERFFKNNKIEAVIHFAAYTSVEESMKDPIKYYENNVVGTINLLKAMINNNVRKIIFSSTAAVYEATKNVPLLETDILLPHNVYGKTKLDIENILESLRVAKYIDYIVLRYFNASGADKSGIIGEAHKNETHLIPLVLQVALGKRDKIYIYGDDYDTNDGTCIRDYIHVSDLAQAHVKALSKLRIDGVSDIYNLGNGKGFSVKEVIEMAKSITKMPIRQEISSKREGDVPYLVASYKKAKEELGWEPKYKNLGDIIETAWNWHKKMR
jgi:UDP-glucose 4-epimerase